MVLNRLWPCVELASVLFSRFLCCPFNAWKTRIGSLILFKKRISIFFRIRNKQKFDADCKLFWQDLFNQSSAGHIAAKQTYWQQKVLFNNISKYLIICKKHVECWYGERMLMPPDNAMIWNKMAGATQPDKRTGIVSKRSPTILIIHIITRIAFCTGRPIV